MPSEVDSESTPPGCVAGAGLAHLAGTPASRRGFARAWVGLRSAALALLAGLLTVAAAAQEPRDGKLVFLGNKNIAPVMYLDHGAPAGVAVDLVRALAAHLPQPVEIRAMDWSEAQALVARGQADALIQINETEERKKVYDFSDTLLESQFSIFTGGNRVGISGISSLRGLRVGVEAGGLPLQVLEKDPNIQLTIIPNFLEGFRQLNRGAIDAVVVDYRVGAYVIAANGLRDIKVSGEPIAFSYSSLAVKKGNTQLLHAINHALQAIKSDGSYQRILESWQPKEVVFQTREQIARRNYFAAILVLSALFLIAVIWTVTLRMELKGRRAAEAEARKQYSTLRGIIDSTNALIFSVDRGLRYTSFNEGHAVVMKALYGAAIETGRPILDYMTVSQDREAARRNIARALAGEHFVEEAYSGEELRSRRYFHVSHSPIRSADEIIGVAVLAQDISELKQARDALRRSETSYQSIVAAMAEGMVVQAVDAGIVTVNPTAEKILARTSQELLGHVLEDDIMRDAVREDGSPFSARALPWQAALRTGEPQSNVVVGIRTPAGARQWVSINSQPVRDERAAAPAAVVSTFQDITERVHKDAIAALRLHLMQFAATHSLDELLEETVNQAETLTESLIGFYHFVDQGQDTLTLQNWSTSTKARFCKAEAKGMHYPIAEAGVWVDCVRERKGVIHNDYASLPHRKGLPPGHARITRELAVPVMRREKIVAILGVGNKTADYTDRDLETVTLIADLAWDIADRKRAEEEQQRLNRELRAVSNCNQTLMRAQEEQALLDAICRIVCDEAGYLMAWVGYAEHDERKTVRPRSCAGVGHEDLAAVRLTWGDAEGGDDPAGRAIRTRSMVCFDDLATEASTQPWREWALARGCASVLAAPLLDDGGNAFGVLSIYSTETHAFTAAEQRLLDELSGDLAFGVTVLRGRAELKRAEAERAAQVRFLEALERVGRTMRGATDLDTMMGEALEVVMSIFDCDRAYLMHPCDPDAAAWSVPMQRTKPQYPSLHVSGVPMAADTAQALRLMLASDGPVQFGPAAAHPVPRQTSERFAIKSTIGMALHPKVGAPWQFGMHQCAHARLWTAWEEQLFAEIGRQIEQALTSVLMYNDVRAREREFRALAENSPDVIVRYDTACRRIYVNPEYERVNRLRSGQVLGTTPEQLSTELAPMAATFTEKLKEVIASGVKTKIDLAWRRDGRSNLWYVRAVPEFDSQGRVASVLTIWSDITELKATEAKIRSLNAELSATLQAIPDLLFDMDGNGTYCNVWANDETLLIAQKEALLGRSVHDMLPAEAAGIVMEALAEAGKAGSSFGRVMRLDLAGGTRWFELSVSKKADSGGPPSRFIMLSRDVTQRKLAEDAVRKLNQELEQRVAERTADLQRANAELEAFSYSVSHDLRAPLAAIGGFSHMLTRKHASGMDEEVRRYLERIHANAVHMGSLIDDLLNFSLTSRREMTMAPVNMGELAREVFEEVRAAVPKRTIELRLGELPAAMGDRAMIRQVLVNLFSNAVKYTAPRAEAKIEMAGVAEGERNTYRITDNGVGFDMQYAGKLFGVFQRLHGPAEFEGTGIGLAIVKRVVERHRGHVWAEGKVDAGATVHFTLPRA